MNEKLLKMSKDQLNARLKEIGAQAKTAEGEALDALLAEAQEIRDILDQAKKRETLAGIADSAEDPEPNEGEKDEPADDKDVKAFSKRGEAVKNGKSVKYNARTVSRGIKNSLSVEQTAPVVHTASDIKETFNDVSSLIDRVKAVNLPGGETYERGYIKGYGDGAGTKAEGADYNATEPVFGYVTIEKQKITAYTEEPEEMIKLPNADYDGVVESSVTKAVRRYISRQILIGDGTTSKLKGIFFKPAQAADDVIDRSTDLTLEGVDDSTLDEIIYSYGGEEDVESVAVLILNKLDLKALAKLRDKQGRKVYTIINNGNTGSIDGVPYIINSACGVVTARATADSPYCMAYGSLDNYELAIFSDIDAKRSDDYKFKSGQTAYRASIFVGGAVAAKNGFIRVKRKATS